MPRIDVLCHYMVPKHTLLTEDEVAEVLENFKITKNQLPKILRQDPAARAINAAEGDVVKIERESSTAGHCVAYRLVVDKETLI